MTGPKTADVAGELSLLGVTKPLVLKATLNGGMKEHPFAKKPAVGFSAVATLKRSDFGMTHLVPNVGDEVQIIMEIEFFGS
jgi:polyisoprenoid-binding protein YceI